MKVLSVSEKKLKIIRETNTYGSRKLILRCTMLRSDRSTSIYRGSKYHHSAGHRLDRITHRSMSPYKSSSSQLSRTSMAHLIHIIQLGQSRLRKRFPIGIETVIQTNYDLLILETHKLIPY